MPTKAPMFKKIQPKAVSALDSQIVTTELLDSERRIPLVIRPAHDDVDLVSWAGTERSRIDAWLHEHGALLFRDFGITDPEPFEAFAAKVCDELFPENTEHPHDSVSGNVYTPVFYAPEKQLLWHNENSFNHEWPAKILFCAARPAREGGETPVVDSRAVYEHIDPAVRRAFEDKGVLYVRNYGEGVGLSWQTVFHSEDRHEIERKCRENRMEWEWKEGGRLKTLARRPAIVRHPVTGEKSWFNQAQHWHVSCLDEETRRSARTLFAEDDLPRNCYYGDGTPIPDSAMAHILEVYRKLEVAFPWQRGDVMLVDNVLAAHGRNSYVPPRKLLVALGEMWSYPEGGR